MVAAAAAGLAACTAQTPKASLKTDIDSLSYATGMARTEGLVQYLTQQLGMDTTYMAQFMEGFAEGSQMVSDKDVARMAGMQIGQMVSKNWVEGLNQQIFGGDSTRTLSKNDMLAGFVAGVKNDTTYMKKEFAQQYAQEATQRVQEKVKEEKYGAYKAENVEFLANNKGKEGVVTTESGLQYKVVKEGKGEKPTATSKVKVKYTGTLIDGTEFDSSGDNARSFRVNQLVQGWTEALQLMPVGSVWEIYVPESLGYGSADRGKIKPFSTLIFTMELVEIEK